MKLETTRLGCVEIAESQVLEFEKGLFGFEGVHRYVLLGHSKSGPFKWLQAVERSDLAFVVMEPIHLVPDYEVQMSEADAAALGWPDNGDFSVVVIVGIPDNPEEMTANLKGPIVFDRTRQLGRQIIMPGDRYSPRFHVVDAMRRRRQEDIHAAGSKGSSVEGGTSGIHG